MIVSRRLLRSCATILILCLGTAVSGPAMAAPHPGVGPGSGDADVLAYWTPERMAKAHAEEQPLPVREVRQTDAHGDAARPPKPAQGVTKTTPVKEHGRIFFTLNKDTSCSAASVDSPNGSLVLTAAHCMAYPQGPGGVARNVIYVPAYQDKVAPYGRWVAASIKVPERFSDNDLTHDMGLVTVKKQNGKTLKESVGGHPIDFSGALVSKTVAHGYPVLAPFDGEKYFTMDSPVWRDSSCREYNSLLIYSTMNGGSSGGSWVTDGRIVSLNSFKYDTSDVVMYGPRWGPKTKALYDAVAALPAPD